MYRSYGPTLRSRADRRLGRKTTVWGYGGDRRALGGGMGLMTAARPQAAATPAEKTQTAPVRLSVNLGAQPAAALLELMDRKDISATEAIRRALSVWKFIEDERERGRGF